jgi:hypothetical protein
MLDQLEKELMAALKEKPPADKAPPVKPTKAR